MIHKNGSQYQIIGAGPVGCYLAYQLLAHTNATVVLFEGRLFNRPQVLRIPYTTACSLPQQVIDKMWFSAETKHRLFSPHSTAETDFWPKPGYQYWTFISIQLFQEAMLHFLKTDDRYRQRFIFVSEADSHFRKATYASALFLYF